MSHQDRDSPAQKRQSSHCDTYTLCPCKNNKISQKPSGSGTVDRGDGERETCIRRVHAAAFVLRRVDLSETHGLLDVDIYRGSPSLTFDAVAEICRLCVWRGFYVILREARLSELRMWQVECTCAVILCESRYFGSRFRGEHARCALCVLRRVSSIYHDAIDAVSSGMCR